MTSEYRATLTCRVFIKCHLCNRTESYDIVNKIVKRGTLFHIGCSECRLLAGDLEVSKLDNTGASLSQLIDPSVCCPVGFWVEAIATNGRLFYPL